MVKMACAGTTTIQATDAIVEVSAMSKHEFIIYIFALVSGAFLGFVIGWNVGFDFAKKKLREQFRP